MQMLREIRVQRDMGCCGNALKLFKIYETERFLNIMIEYQDGGTLQDFIKKQGKHPTGRFSEG